MLFGLGNILCGVSVESQYIKGNSHDNENTMRLHLQKKKKSVARFSALFCWWGLAQPSAFKGINKGLSYLFSSWEENVNELQPYPFQRSSFNCLIWVDLIGGRSSISSAFATNTAAATGTPACGGGILRTTVSVLPLCSVKDGGTQGGATSHTKPSMTNSLNYLMVAKSSLGHILLVPGTW